MKQVNSKYFDLENMLRRRIDINYLEKRINDIDELGLFIGDEENDQEKDELGSADQNDYQPKSSLDETKGREEMSKSHPSLLPG